MKNLLRFFAIILSLSLASAQVSEFVKWQTLKFKNVPANAPYNASIVVPFGISHFNGKIFVSIARRNPGIPATLATVELNGNPPYVNPSLIPYPNYDVQSESNQPNQNKFISVYRTRIDKCGNLWFVDTGVLEYSSGSGSRQVVQKPSLWAISLATDQVIWRYEFPSSSVPGDGMGMISVVLDDDDCSNIFAYIPDVYTNAIVVVDTKNAKSWRFTHNYFRSNPFEGDFDVDGFKFQWDDGIFSVALSNKKPDGFKTAFFHPLAAHGEFTVSTKILRNENLASRTWHDKDFKFIGFDTKSNRGIHVFDSNKRVLFFAEMQKNGVSCWNPKGKEQLRSSEVHMIAQNNQTMIYPVDIEIDNDSNLWIISNRLPRFIYGRFDYNLYNFNIFKGKTDDVLRNSGCL